MAFRPTSSAELAEIIAGAMADKAPLAVRGRGSKQALGHAMVAHDLDLSGLSGVIAYEPEELILQAQAATPLAEIEAMLAARGQQLAFEPPDLGSLLGGVPGAGSIGGVIACNLSGPRRIRAGAARDHLLGVTACSGRGEIFKAGGRVVKNVTGYDMCKLLAGSYGTLAVMTEVTVKVLPAPDKVRTVLVYGNDDTQGLAAMTRALASPYEISAAAHLPAAVAARSSVEHVRRGGASVTALRIDGPPASCAERCAQLRTLLGGETEELHTKNAQIFWREVRDVSAFVGDARAVWRISVAPQSGPAIAASIARLPGAAYYYDWGGGLIWAAVAEQNDAGAEIIRTAVAGAGGGHATLMRGSEAMRARVPVFEPQPPAIAALNRRIKEAFDPAGILNPGRIAA